jgi:hypothetical protein
MPLHKGVEKRTNEYKGDHRGLAAPDPEPDVATLMQKNGRYFQWPGKKFLIRMTKLTGMMNRLTIKKKQNFKASQKLMSIGMTLSKG